MLNRKRTTTVATRSAEKDSRMPNISTAPPPPRTRSLVLTFLAAISAAVLLTISLAPVADAQSPETVTGRITARLLADDRIEFGWQPSVGARVLPRQRFWSESLPRGRWLNSSEVIVDGAEIGKINVRVENGRVEFAFTPEGGERIRPSARYFPTNARVNRWLYSTDITFTLGPPTESGDGGTQSPPSAGDLIRVAGTEDVYEVKGNFRRLIVAGGIIDVVPEFRWEDISDITQAAMNRYEVSRLVRLPDGDSKVYLVVPVGLDSAVLRDIPDETAFNSAGCNEDAVYDITEQEASFSGYSKGETMPSSGWSCR